MNFSKIVGVSIFALTAFCPSAHASFVGDSFSVAQLYPNQTDVVANLGTQVIGKSGTVFSNASNATDPVEVTISSKAITIWFNNIGSFASESSLVSFNGLSFTDNTNPLPLLTVGSGTNLSGITNANLTESGNAAFINLADLSFSTDTQIVIDVSAVPIPATLPLFVTAVFGLGVVTRRWKNGICRTT